MHTLEYANLRSPEMMRACCIESWDARTPHDSHPTLLLTSPRSPLTQIETVATTLALAEQNNARELKRVCLEFVSKHLQVCWCWAPARLQSALLCAARNGCCAPWAKRLYTCLHPSCPCME